METKRYTKWIVEVFAVTALLGILACLPAHSEDRVYSGYLVNEKALSYSKTYDLKLDTIDDLSMQAIYSSATFSAATFTDGTPATSSITIVSTSGLTNARIGVDGYPFDNGTNWASVSTVSGNAKALADAINATPGLNALIVSTFTTGGVVYSTAAAVGTAANSFAQFSSTPTAIFTQAKFSGGTNSAINVATDKITVPGHGYTTGLPVLFAKSAGTVPTGLTDGTTYYAIVADKDTIQLASSLANAKAGTAIDITATTTLGGGTFTLTPTPFAGTWSFNFTGSNDGVNFFTLSNASNVTYSAPGTTEFDGPIYFRFLRFNFTAGTGGGMNIQVIGNGKRKS